MSLQNQRILLTGATGFIGGRVARRLLAEKSTQVRVLARDPARAKHLEKSGAEVMEGCLEDVAALERAAGGCSIVIHAAAQVSSVPSRETFVASNVEGTHNLLRAASAAGVRRFVHISSIAAFGLPLSGEISDHSPRATCGDPYCDTKYLAEEAVFGFATERRLPAVILRPSSVYGPGSTHWSVIPLKRLKKGKMFLVDGGRGTLNYVYIDNLVDAILLAAGHERAPGQAFSVNDGVTTWRDYFGAYAHMAGKIGIPSFPLWVARLWVRGRNVLAAIRGETARVPPNALAFLVGSPVYRQTHIEQTLGHRSRVDLPEGLRRTEAWFRETGLL